MSKRKGRPTISGYPDRDSEELKYWLAITCTKCSSFLSKDQDTGRVWCKRCERLGR